MNTDQNIDQHEIKLGYSMIRIVLKKEFLLSCLICIHSQHREGRQNQVHHLLDYLLRNTVWRFHAFLLSLVETSQGHVLEALNINTSMYSCINQHIDHDAAGYYI